MAKLVMHAYAWTALAVTVVGLGAILVAPPADTRVDRNGVPYFTPQVLNPATGEAIEMGDLIRHYRGD